MNNLDRMKFLMLLANDLNDAMQVYENIKAVDKVIYPGCNVPMHCNKKAIKRRITQMRQDLLLLEKGL